MADLATNKLTSTLSAEEDVKNSSSDASMRAKEASKTHASSAGTGGSLTVQEDEDGAELSPMRTHEQSGYSQSIADRMCHLVEQSDDEDETQEKDVNHEKLERKELRRQKTSDRPNRMRDRLKRTVSKAG